MSRSLSSVGPVMLVGAGKMGLALAQGWLDGGLPPANLILIDPAPAEATLALVEDYGLNLYPEASGIQPNVVVVAVKPQIIDGVLEALRPVIGRHTVGLSIAAGIDIARLQRGLDTDRVVRTMPNTPAQVGKGMTGAVAAPAVDEAAREGVGALLAAVGKVAWFDDEADIDALTAVSGSGPAYVFYLVEALAAAGEQQGLSPDVAMTLARQTIVGAAALLDADPTSAAQLRKNVTSPNGTTAAALEVLMAPDGLAPVLDRAVAAARRRSEELGQS
jgi:pyrroline-5-carboxylate reductase